MTDRYQRAFSAAKEAGETLFMPYTMAGFPSRAESADMVRALVDGGAGAIELGIPFSDPLADGPTIQRANTRALADGANMAFVLDLVRELRATGVEIPITLMGYLNPLLAYGRAHGAGEAGGLEPIARDAAAAGADGMIIVDLPPEESDEAVVALRANGLALIYLIAPTSPPERIQAIADRASGFVYLVSVTGVTGARDELPSDLVDFVARVQAMIPLPLAVGFGISNRAQVETIGALCEAAVIGSAVITTIEEAPPDERVSKLRAFGTSITAG